MQQPAVNLRPCEPEDLDLLYTIENDPEMWNTSNSDAPYSRFAIRQYIAQAESIQSCGELRLVIELRLSEDKAVAIGLLDLTNYSSLHARAEIGIALLKKFQGKGYARQAIAQLEDFAVRRLRIHTLYAVVSPENSASFKLFVNAGYNSVARLPQWWFTPDGYRNVEVFAKFF